MPLISIQEFPNDGRYWRVDWFGEITRNLEIPSESLVETIISPFIKDPAIEDPSSNRSMDHSQRTRIEIGVGQLPFVPIGSIWKNRSKTSLYAGKSEFFQDLPINPDTVRLVRVGHVDNGTPIIPENYYRLNAKSALRSFCIAIQVDEDPFGILIPVMEIIRFYYAGSTDLARSVFNGDFAMDPASVMDQEKSGIYTKTEDGKEKTIFRYFPRRHMADEDGWTVGRILLSKPASNNVKRIFDSIMRNRTNENLGLPESGFPFIGNTDLKIHGKRIACGDIWRTLVFRIDWCDGPFPFDELEIAWDRGRHDDLDDYSQEPSYIPDQHRRTRSVDDSEPMRIRSDRNPAIQADISQVFLPSSRFGALRR